MADKAGKGRITLEDVAKGIQYNQEAYHTAAKFQVFTPDLKSQEKFFGTNNYTHKYLVKEKRSPFVDYEGKNVSHSMVSKDIPSTTNEAPPKPQPQEPPKKEQNVSANPNPHAHHQKTALNSPVKSVSKPAQSLRPGTAKNFVMHPRELYAPHQASVEDSYGLANPFSVSKYYDMKAALRLPGNPTLGEVLKKSEEARKKLSTTLGKQRDREHLRMLSLPPVPSSRAALVISNIATSQDSGKRAVNVAHRKITNGGYTRASYGGFYMH